jgi:hypothetical protein
VLKRPAYRLYAILNYSHNVSVLQHQIDLAFQHEHCSDHGISSLAYPFYRSKFGDGHYQFAFASSFFISRDEVQHFVILVEFVAFDGDRSLSCNTRLQFHFILNHRFTFLRAIGLGFLVSFLNRRSALLLPRSSANCHSITFVNNSKSFSVVFESSQQWHVTQCLFGFMTSLCRVVSALLLCAASALPVLCRLL